MSAQWTAQNTEQCKPGNFLTVSLSSEAAFLAQCWGQLSYIIFAVLPLDCFVSAMTTSLNCPVSSSQRLWRVPEKAGLECFSIALYMRAWACAGPFSQVWKQAKQCLFKALWQTKDLFLLAPQMSFSSWRPIPNQSKLIACTWQLTKSCFHASMH